ncbi:gastrotropin isoform X1 [Anolis sagrei]|uniref:gastrotropin isoform X1 n=1 Tax=Anolis sagrei TaxID=38937 RepID=UPI00352241F0
MGPTPSFCPPRSISFSCPCGGRDSYPVSQLLQIFGKQPNRSTIDENQICISTELGIPADTIEKGRNFKIVTEVMQNGDEFIWSQIYPGGKSMTNKFVIGKESEIETLGGKKFKATVKMEGGKVVADFPNYHHTAEIAGGKLVEISTVGDVTFKRVSKKLA